MKHLIILISFIASLFITSLVFIKKSYKYATIQDSVDTSNYHSKLKQKEVPLDYEVK